jgi:transmembrane sensor
MDHQVTKTDRQIASVLSGNANTSEIEELQQWQELSAGNKKILDDSLKVWDSCPNPFTKTEREQDKAIINGRIITQTALQQKHDRVIMRFLRVAAIFIGPLMLAIGWYLGSNNLKTNELTWNTVTAPRKHIAVCTLTDGTEVWLNAGSSISYPAGEQMNKREVKLTGEGYFKVTKNPKKPFFVITQFATVKVLGTIFNMKAYPGADRIVTTLEEGSVEFYIQNSKIPNLRLKPGEQAVYATKEGRIDLAKVDASLFSSWRNDKFVFKDADLKTIISELERLYDIKIYIKNPRLEKLRFRGMFSYDQDLLDAFETLKRSVKLNYTIKGREVWLE